MLYKITLIILQIIFWYMVYVATCMYGTLGYSIPVGLLLSYWLSKKIVENLEKNRLREIGK